MELNEKTILKTFKNPCNIHHIKYMFKCDLDYAQKIIFKLLNDEVIKESEYVKEYYVLK